MSTQNPIPPIEPGDDTEALIESIRQALNSLQGRVTSIGTFGNNSVLVTINGSLTAVNLDNGELLVRNASGVPVALASKTGYLYNNNGNFEWR